ncbi:MAG: hypothetical protein IT378_03685 [Sandaracinaceae bacterium]|nr:hypothetical protein [Sandaracinaceae bacterium]
MREVTDAELEQAAKRVRRHAQKERLAKLAGMGIAMAFVGAALALLSVIQGDLADALRGRAIMVAGLAGFLLGALAYKKLEPKDDPFES